MNNPPELTNIFQGGDDAFVDVAVIVHTKQEREKRRNGGLVVLNIHELQYLMLTHIYIFFPMLLNIHLQGTIFGTKKKRSI